MAGAKMNQSKYSIDALGCPDAIPLSGRVEAVDGALLRLLAFWPLLPFLPTEKKTLFSRLLRKAA